MKLVVLACSILVGCGSEFSGRSVEEDGGREDAEGASGGSSSDGAIDPGDSSDGASFGSGGIGGAGGSGGSESTGGSDIGSGGSDGTGGASESTGGSSNPNECVVGVAQCVDAQRQTCVGGVWLDNGAPCPGWCINGACVDCKPGAKSCASDTQPRTCGASGSWSFDAACSGDKPWCDNGSCFGLCCNAGAFQTYCSDSGEPWHKVFTCGPSGQTGDCTSLNQCAAGSVCVVPGSYTGTIARCL
jgi:hypothetical protein